MPNKPNELDREKGLKKLLKKRLKELTKDIRCAYANYVEVSGEGYTPLDRLLAKANYKELRDERFAILNQLTELN